MLPIVTSHLHLAQRTTPKNSITTPTLSLEISYILNICYFINFHMSSVKFTHAGYVILQLILYKLWSKLLLSVFNPISCWFWHHNYIQLEELPQEIVSYLIFRNQLLLNIFYFTNFQLPLGILIQTTLLEVKFIHCYHVILQQYFTSYEMLLQAFEPYN